MMVTAALLVLGACSGDPADPGHFDGLSANVRSMRSSSRRISVSLRDSVLPVGDTATLVVGIRDRFGRDVSRFLSAKFRSNDTTVATVNSKGLVTIEGEGSTWIVVRTSSELRDSVAVGTTTLKFPEGTARSPNAPVEVEPAPAVPPSTPPAPTLPDNLRPDVPAAPETGGQVVSQTASLPRERLLMRAPVRMGRLLSVSRGQSIQRAVDSARFGDEILLERGVTFTENVRLRKKSGTGWIRISGGGFSGREGVRIRPSDLAGGATLQTGVNAEPAIQVEPGAEGYWMSGFEVTAAPSVTTMYNLVMLDANVTSIDQLPSRLVIDRMWIHGRSDLSMQRCIMLGANRSQVVESWVSDCHASGFDSQAILIANGQGVLLVRNNRLEGAGENLMIGGLDPSVPGLVPADIEIAENYFFKPLAWQGGRWTVKNLLEIKYGIRVDVNSNYFENNWVDGQNGFGILLRGSKLSGQLAGVRTMDITFRHNVLTNSAGGISVFADTPEGVSRIAILENLVERIGAPALGTNARLLQFGGAIASADIAGNTFLHASSGVVQGVGLMLDGSGANDISFRSNILDGGLYGVFRSGTAMGMPSIVAYGGETFRFTGNAITADPAVRYPSGNLVLPQAQSAFGFASFTGRDYTLTSSSPLRGYTPRLGSTAATLSQANLR